MIVERVAAAGRGQFVRAAWPLGLLALAMVLMGADCNVDITDATLLVPPQPDGRAVQLVLAQGAEPHALVEGALAVGAASYAWRDLGAMTTPVCVPVNRWVAANYGYLCRQADGACVRVVEDAGRWSHGDCR